MLFDHRMLLGVVVLLAQKVNALTVAIDYSSTTSDFFNINHADSSIADRAQLARNAVNAAADSISQAITTKLTAVNSMEFTASGASIDYTIGHHYAYYSTEVRGAQYFSGSLAEDEFRVFVGAASTSGASGVSGLGRFSTVVTGSATTEEEQLTANVAAALAQTGLSRGGIIRGTQVVDRDGISYSYDYGASVGYTGFAEWDENYWHYDHTTSVELGKVDLYTVAQQQILHALGVGSFWTPWNENVLSSADWIGENFVALHGSGEDVMWDYRHFENGIMSQSYIDGAEQEMLMTSGATAGERKELTYLDLAALNDMGWQVIDLPDAELVPEPSTSAMLVAFASITLMRRKRQ